MHCISSEILTKATFNLCLDKKTSDDAKETVL